jgi:CheY-like chemotaxis protein
MSEEPAETTPATRSEVTVLVVDDEQGNRTSLEKIFEREGMRVLSADGA